MHWSLFSLVALLVVLIAQVTALPTPQDGSSELFLERLAVTKPKEVANAKAGTVKTLNYKKSSQMYPNTPLKGRNPMFSMKAGNLVDSKAPEMIPKVEDADYILVAQTMGHAARKGGQSSTTFVLALKAVADRLDINHPNLNMAFLDPKTNRAKGRAHTAVQSGRTPAKDENIAECLKQIEGAGKATAAGVDKVLKAQRIQGLSVYFPVEVRNKEVPYGLSIL